MSERSVIEHALTVYYDGNAKLAGQVVDMYRDFVAHELAEQIRDERPQWGGAPGGAWFEWGAAADLIDPEVE